MPSTENGRGSHIKSNSSTEIVTDSGENVKGQHSISAPGRQDIVRDLRSILERGGDPAELRRYVDSLEQNTNGAEQNAHFAEHDTVYADQNTTEAEQTARREERTADAARKILQAARNEGLSAEEYLSQNWELYEVDGQWDADARAALELEHRESRAKHAISKPAGVGVNQHKIFPGMDDAQRASVLSQKKIHVPAYDSSNTVTGPQIIRLKGKYVTEARALLSELARQCGDFQSDLRNADIDLTFAYSNKSLKESVNKQSKRGGGAETFGKMLTVLPQICENAVEIEAHTDRYTGTAREDGNLKEMHVLLGAFADGTETIPVQLEVKEYIPESKLSNKLYVTVTIKNEAGVTPRISAADLADENARSRPASVITVADLIANVKDETGGLVKYLPDQMLNSAQLEAKEKALAEDAVRLGDMRYEYAVEQGNQEAVENMLQERAKKAGYSAEDDWRMAHRAPNREQGVTLDRADEVYGGDGSIYSSLAHRYYGDGRSYDIKSIMAINKARQNPNGSITVYRAVPANIRDTKLRNGDWVTPTKEYAKEHGERTFDNGFRVIEQQVPVKYLYINGDSIHEFGYDNGRETEVYKNTENNVKLAEVTYDDEGNLIPLSQRFNEDNPDTRHSISKPAVTGQEDPAAAEQADETAENIADVRSVLPKKARDYLKRAERKLLNKVGQSLGVPYLAKRDVLTPIIQEISDGEDR